MQQALPTHLFSHAPSQFSGELARPSVNTNEASGLFPLVELACRRSEFVTSVWQQEKEALLDILYQHWQSDDLTWYEQCLTSQGPAPAWMDRDEFSVQTADDWLSLDEASAMRRLRKCRRLHSAALAILNLSNWIDLPQAALRMSLVADYLIRLAYRWSYYHLSQTYGAPQSQPGIPDNLLILGMGKLGGWELNFSSDIDLIFFYPQKGETISLPLLSPGKSRACENFRFWQRCGSQIIKLLDTRTAEGFVFRTDMRLRPYGESGPLVMSLAEAEDYYQEQGRDWERFAMVRARIITGREEEQASLSDIIRPFAFRRYIDYGVLDAIRGMKAMIEREVRSRGLNNNIKLRAGGIREVEFIVQSMQLIQGGRDKSLQEKNLLAVLPLLVRARMLPDATATELAMAWRWLRKLEDTIQALAEKQTQQIPTDPAQLTIVAEVFDLNTEQLIQKTEAICQRVRWHFSQLLKQDQEQKSQSDWAQALWESAIETESLKKHIRADSEVLQETVRLIDLFHQEKRILSLSTRGRKRLNQFMPDLLEQWASRAPEVETLRRLLAIISAVVKRTAYLELLSENPPLLEHLVQLVSRSEWITIRLANYPILLDELLYPNSLYQPLNREQLTDELRQFLLRVDKDEESQMNCLRQFKQINELRIAAAFLTERISIREVSRCLSDLATVLIEQVLWQCWLDIGERYGLPAGVNHQTTQGVSGFAILAYGKLGGRELGFGSDLDLVFVFDAKPGEKTRGERAVEISRFYTRLGQKIIHYLSTKTHLGDLFEVDMRLRPSGNSGLLVSGFDAFSDYQKTQAWTWEHQALVRARVVAGDPELGKKIDSLRWDILSRQRDQEQLKKDVLEMRQKMRQQLWKKAQEDLKQMPGGIVDIEFIAQYLALAYSHLLAKQSATKGQDAGEHNPLPTNTAEILNTLSSVAPLTSDQIQLLTESYHTWCHATNLALLTHQPTNICEDKIGMIANIWRSIFEVND